MTATSVTIVTPMTTVSNTSTRSGPTEYVSATQPGREKFLTDAETYSKKIADTTKCTPNDVSNSVKALAPRTRLNATRSITSDVNTETTMISGTTKYHDHPPSIAQKAAYPETVMSSPWAKLSRCITPKMTAIPSARSA